ncbi:GNAT family N-acetyltransferase [Glutamicibacter sp. AOP5-A2-18]|uniref:GNAT family N-acetyltransferase n=1 Tax=Glutamicibacter sp. AOP5-A2-18 TaxID=3457656 RepID=UPI0040339575
MDIKVVEADPLDESIQAMVRQHLADMEPTAPTESRHALDSTKLGTENIFMFQVCVGETAIAMGAFKDLGEHVAELKSMRVSPEFRGRGIGRRLLDELISCAAQRGFTRLYLETGTHPYFTAARRMYQAAGFGLCPPFGDYQLDPNSVFYQRAIG